MEYDSNTDNYIRKWAKKIKAVNILGGCCSRCRNDNVVVLDFHHTRDKEFTLKDIRDARWSTIDKEIRKCILFCGNCHSEHHSNPNSFCAKAKQKLLDIKGISCCQECNYKGYGIASLVFHHEHSKSFMLGPYLARQVSIPWVEVIAEIDKCKILCRNCYIMKHFDLEKFERLKQLIDEK